MLLDELRQIEKEGSRERESIRRRCDAEIAEIRRKKEAAIAEIDRKHAETMAAMEADHEEKMQILNEKSKIIHEAIEEAKQQKDFSRVCQLLKEMTESIN